MNFLTVLLVLLMSRPLLTLLRRHSITAAIFPVDQHVFYHKLVGVLLVIFALVHTVAHFVNIGE